MTRDHTLFMAVGLLAGFIGGYVMHESMAARQPPPRRPGTAAATAGAGAAAAEGRGAPSPGGQAAMEQVQRLTAYVQENPDDAAAIRSLANLKYDIGNWQRAAELYQRYLELDASDLDVRTDLGATYRYLGRPQEALEQFRQVRELAPDHWQARYNEVLVLAFDLEDLTAAATAMDQLRVLQPDNPEVERLAAELEKRTRGG